VRQPTKREDRNRVGKKHNKQNKQKTQKTKNKQQQNKQKKTKNNTQLCSDRYLLKNYQNHSLWFILTKVSMITRKPVGTYTQYLVVFIYSYYITTREV
jgi:hypothetical protein